MRSFQSIVGLAGLVCSALIEVPFGDSRLNTIRPRTNFDPNNIADAETWGTYATKGGWLNCLLNMTDSEAGKAWPDWVGGGGGGEEEGRRRGGGGWHGSREWPNVRVGADSEDTTVLVGRLVAFSVLAPLIHASPRNKQIFDFLSPLPH